MKKRHTAILAAALVAVVAAMIVYRHFDRIRMIDCVLTWGRLAEFPEDAQGFEIETEGTMFTRAFRASFTATPDIIAEWLSKSPGIADAEKQAISLTTIKYLIQPGGGAQHAEVEVDQEIRLVRIYVAWS